MKKFLKILAIILGISMLLPLLSLQISSTEDTPIGETPFIPPEGNYLIVPLGTTLLAFTDYYVPPYILPYYLPYNYINFELFDSTGTTQITDPSTLIGTDMIIHVYYENYSFSQTAVVDYDINGDGVANQKDLILCAQLILDNNPFSEAQEHALREAKEYDGQNKLIKLAQQILLTEPTTDFNKILDEFALYRESDRKYFGVLRYFGKYSGYDLILLGATVLDEKRTIIIAGYEFCFFEYYYYYFYKDSKFVRLPREYAEGMITDIEAGILWERFYWPVNYLNYFQL